MRSYPSKYLRLSTVVALAGLLVSSAACQSGSRTDRVSETSSTLQPRASIVNNTGATINLTAERMSMSLRDGTPSPMWGFCPDATCPTPVTGAWSPGPTIVATAGQALTISLTNKLPVPTSLVVLGQLGGGLGTPASMASPAHAGQNFQTFTGNAQVNGFCQSLTTNTVTATVCNANLPCATGQQCAFGVTAPNPIAGGLPLTPPNAFVPPVQGTRVRSFGTEVAAGGVQSLTWLNLKPGTYLYETGTMPSLETPMGLYGVLIVNSAAGQAYPGVNFDADAALLFSEVDVAQNKAVDAAASATPTADVNKRFNDPSCTATAPCYPAAVNYAPTYFLINGVSFDAAAPQNSAYQIAGARSSGNVLVRMLNAGSRTHVPSVAGLTMALVAEDGNLAPGNPKLQNEALLTAGKTYDALVKPPAGTAATSYAPNTYTVFDRALSLSSDNNPVGGMQGFLLVNSAAAQTVAASTGSCSILSSAACSATLACAAGAGTCVFPQIPVAGAPGNLPLNVTPAAINDVFAVPCNATFSGDVTANDVGVRSAQVVTANNPTKGALTFSPNGTFTYVPAACTGGTDTFTYNGNTGTTNTATVTLNLSKIGLPPTLHDDFYTSPLASKFSVPRPGVLANDTDPGGYPISVDVTFAAGAAVDQVLGCDSVSINPDGSFNVTITAAAPLCKFRYQGVNSQGSVAQATASITAGVASNLTVSVLDPLTGSAMTDYRWTIQEDLTFKHAVDATPQVSTRTVGTSFHRSHMPVVVAGCVGPISCGQGQSFRFDGVPDPITNSVPVKVNGITIPCTGINGNRCVLAATDALALQTLPSNAVLNRSKNYYLTILPGDAANAVTLVGTCSLAPTVSCSPTSLCNFGTGQGTCVPGGHTMGGAEVKFVNSAWQPVTIKPQNNPLPSAQMSIYIYEDSEPTNGQNEATELPLGGFNIILLDSAGRTGDVAGQNTYDVFNQPLNNYLLGRPGCPDTQNFTTNGTGGTSGFCSINTTQACSTTVVAPDPLACGSHETCVPSGNSSGTIYTCPNPSPDEVTAAHTGSCSNNAARSCTANGNCVAPGTCPVAAQIVALDAKYALAGHALIKNVVPSRYDVLAHPGAAREGAGEVWWQTETLEGTPAQDAFVGVGESQYFQEFGPPGPHVTIGFVNPDHAAANGVRLGLNGNKSISGKVTSNHMSHPSNVQLWDSNSYDILSATNCRVVVNSQAGLGPAIAAASCGPDGTFTVSGLAAGSYDVAIFDQWLDQIIQNEAVIIPALIPATNACAANTVCLGNIPVLSWFTQFDQFIYQDDGSHTYSANTPGVSNVQVSVRFRNGAPSNRPISDNTGNASIRELFPLFNWYVAEADTTRFKQTAVRVIVDGGGKPDVSGMGANLWTSKYADGQFSTRTEVPGALTYGLQGFISQRSRIEWGRTPYATGENGGITGTVVLASTRPFDDQRFNVQNIWEPLIPRLTINLYQQQTLADGTRTLALVDTTTTSSFDDFANTVFGKDGNKYLMGPEYDEAARVGLRLADGTAAPTAAYPAGRQANMQCPGQLPGTTTFPWNTNTNDPFTNFTLGDDQHRCYDGWHDWNQVQAAPYDGRYNFPSAAYKAAHPLCPTDGTPPPIGCTVPAVNQTLVSLPPGTYVVEQVTPPGYLVVKEEDKDILIGDTFTAAVTQQFGSGVNIFIIPDQATIGNANPDNPNTGDPGFQSDPTTNLGSSVFSKQTTFPECAGNLHRVPDFLSLYPQAGLVAPFAGMDRPLCDRKKVLLNDQMQSTANFFIYTEAPVAANNTGIILDDASSEFNAVSPDFGEKASVPFIPVSIKDYTGAEISRTYSDQWGAYNMITPTSWLVNPPTPSGYGPSMLVTCINDPGPIPDPTDPTGTRLITDPKYNPSYSNFCYTNPYVPGQTTYLDTPLLPLAAFASGYNPVDCALPSTSAPGPATTPAISRVDGDGAGPWVSATGKTLTITALGDQQVPNPAYGGPFASRGTPSSVPTIIRHYGFGGTPGTVTVGAVALTNVTWSDLKITGTVSAGTLSGKQLEITTFAGMKSVDTVTVYIEPTTPTRVSGGYTGQTIASAATPGPIQLAIDAATPGDLILVDAGTYNELVIMWKPVRLQGVGAGSVIINAAKYPTSKLEVWRPRINALFSVDPVTGTQKLPAQVSELPTQEITGGVVILEPTVLGAEEGAGITVLAKHIPDVVAGTHVCSGGAISTYGSPVTDSNFLCAASRIDGISVTGGDAGGGIYVNGWAHNLQISNNRVYGNAGAFNGGIRVGVPGLELESLPAGATTGKIAGFGFDVGIKIHHNQISKNGTVEGPGLAGGAGAGLSILAGSDNYEVHHNWICGNFGQSDGGGIGHLGYSQDGSIHDNHILFNQSFQQTGSTHGGGIFVAGESAIAGTVSLGTGNVTITENTIRGNFAEGGHGGGIRLQRVNGADVARSTNPLLWHHVVISNNNIDNNVAGWAGGGISLSDALLVVITGNKVVSNDSTGIAGVVLAGGVALPGPTAGTVGAGYPSPAGIVSEQTSAGLLNLVTNKVLNAISQPVLVGNTIWQNRSFYYSGNGRLCAGNVKVTGTCTVLADQAVSGTCNKANANAAQPNARYWEIGVLGDASTAPGPLHLNPIFDIMSNITGYSSTNIPSLTTGQGTALRQYCNGSRVVPELVTVLNPPSVKNLQVAATVDEGNNYVNLRYGPLYTENPVTEALFGP